MAVLFKFVIVSLHNISMIYTLVWFNDDSDLNKCPATTLLLKDGMLFKQKEISYLVSNCAVIYLTNKCLY